VDSTRLHWTENSVQSRNLYGDPPNIEFGGVQWNPVESGKIHWSPTGKRGREIRPPMGLCLPMILRSLQCDLLNYGSDS